MVKHIEKATQLGQNAFSFFGRQCSRRLAVRRETNFASALLLFPRLSACQLLTIRSSSARDMLRAHREHGAARARARGERARQPHAVSFCFSPQPLQKMKTIFLRSLLLTSLFRKKPKLQISLWNCSTMHPYSGGSKLASVSPGPGPQKGVQNEAREMFQRGEVEATSKRAHHLNVEGVDRKQSPKKKNRSSASRRSASGWSTVRGSCRLSRARRPRPRRRRRRRPLTAEGTEF